VGGIKENDGGSDSTMIYMLRNFVNVPMYPQHNNNIIKIIKINQLEDNDCQISYQSNIQLYAMFKKSIIKCKMLIKGKPSSGKRRVYRNSVLSS
jgi:hypothetical protein